MNILVTGGAGYIGSHTIVELLNNGHTVTVIDNLSNSSRESLSRVEKITGKSIEFHEADVCDESALDAIFNSHKIDAVIHFAGLKAVGESVEKPLLYYRNNLDSTLSLLEAMERHGIRKIVFSSSATVYGNPKTSCYSESLPAGQNITNPYGQTKYMIEQMLRDMSFANPSLEVTLLRYFNPIGAHASGMIGESPIGKPNNIMPFISQVASGKRDKLSIFGNDYPTPDGTCRRDYIHVVDLAKGHIAALTHLKPGVQVFNLGSGEPVSVLELVNTFIKVSGQEVPYIFVPRRDGDLSEYYADPKKAQIELGWHTEKTIEDMCRDTWNWQAKNPSGYEQ